MSRQIYVDGKATDYSLDAVNEILYQYDLSGDLNQVYDFKGPFSDSYTPPTGIFADPQPSGLKETLDRLGELFKFLNGNKQV
jgi:hypothetical protein